MKHKPFPLFTTRETKFPKHFNYSFKFILTSEMKLFTVMSIKQYTLLLCSQHEH